MNRKMAAIILSLRTEADGLFLAYSEVSRRLKKIESENIELKKKLKEKDERISKKSVGITNGADL